MSEEYKLKNVEKNVIRVFWASLTQPDNGSRFQRECPFCLGGVLPVTRDKDTFQLEEYDICLLCAQQVQYNDIEAMRRIDRGEKY
jgi:hypothetical protein